MPNDIGTAVQNLLILLMAPFRGAMEAVGLHPSDLQVWALIVALLMAVLILPTVYGDIVLARRRHQALGTIVAIQTDGDGVRTPLIEFLDSNRRTVRFTSMLPVTAATTAVGDTVPIIYDPRRPSRAREAGRPLIKLAAYLLWWGFIAGALAFAVQGASS